MGKVTSQDLKDLSSKDPRIKYRRAKKLVAAAKKYPEELYPHFKFFSKLLASDNQILKWTAIDIIGFLSKVDDKKRVDRLVSRLFGFLAGGKLITAAHAVSALTEIARAKPEYQAQITEELLKVEHYAFDTTECRNICLGKVILALGSYGHDLNAMEKQKIAEFAERQTRNRRRATRKKAEIFLKNFS